MKKVLFALLLSFVLFGCADTDDGEKCVSVEIVYENQDINSSNEYCTDEKYLLGLLEEHSEELELTTAESNLGTYLTGLKGYDFEALELNYYWSIYVNGEYGVLGIADQPIKQGDVFRFEATPF